MMCGYHIRRLCAAVDALYPELVQSLDERHGRVTRVDAMLTGDEGPMPLHGFHQVELDEAFRFLVRMGWIRVERPGEKSASFDLP